MTTVYYFGGEASSPNCTFETPNDDLKKLVAELNAEELEIIREIIEPGMTSSTKIGSSIEIAKKIKNDNPENNTPLRALISVKCGPKYAIFKDNFDSLWSVGQGIFGQLGAGKGNISSRTPLYIKTFKGKNIANYSCGESHVLAVTENNELYGWGDSRQGKLGTSYEFMGYEPRKVILSNFVLDELKFPPIKEALAFFEDNIEMQSRNNLKLKNDYTKNLMLSIRWRGTACGSDHTFFIGYDKVFGCGAPDKGKLGLGAQLNPITSPQVLTTFNGKKIMGIACNKSHSIAWDSNGACYSWGDGTDGKLGHLIEKNFHLNPFEIYPRKIDALSHAYVVGGSCGASHSCALTSNGEIFTWGKIKTVNPKNGSQTFKYLDYFKPKMLCQSEFEMKSDIFFIKVVSGTSHNAAIDKEGRLYTWGDSTDNCLGYQSDVNIFQPKLVNRFGDQKVIDVGCGELFTFVIVSNPKSPYCKKIFDEFQQTYLNYVKNKLDTFKESQFIKSKNKQENIKNNALHSHTNQAGHELPMKTNETQISDLQMNKSESAPVINDKTTELPSIKGALKVHPQLYQYTCIILTQFCQHCQKSPDADDIIGFVKQRVKNKQAPATISLDLLDYISSQRQISLDSTERSEIASLIQNNLFDPITSQLAHKPDYEYELEDYKSKKSDELDEEKLEKRKKNLREMEIMAQTFLDDKNSKIVHSLYDEIQTQNEQLKYEYIEIVRNGREEEHMMHLLKDFQGADKDQNYDRKEPRMKPKYFDIIDDIIIKKQDIVNKSLGKTRKLLKDNPMKELMEELSTERNELKRRMNPKLREQQLNEHLQVIKYNDRKHGKTVSKMFSPFRIKEYSPEKSPEAFRARKLNDIKKNSESRELKIEKAKKMKEELYEQKKTEMLLNAQKKNSRLKEKERLKIEKEILIQASKSILPYLFAEIMYKTINVISEKGLESKRNLFKYNMKARFIQITFRKFRITKKLESLPIVRKALLRVQIRKYKYLKRVRNIVLTILYREKLRAKMRASLLLIKHRVLKQYAHVAACFANKQPTNIQKFKYTDAYSMQLKAKAQETAHQDNDYMKKSLKRIGTTPGSNDNDATTTTAPAKPNLNTPDINKYSKYVPKEFLMPKNGIGGMENSYEKLKLLPSFLPTTIIRMEDIGRGKNDDISTTTSPTRQLGVKFPNANNQYVDISTGNPQNKYVPQEETLLPFTLHSSRFNLPANYRIKFDTSGAQDAIFQQAVQFEAKIKFDMINSILKAKRRKYVESHKEYVAKLKAFRDANIHAINLERARRMLLTPVEKLKTIQKKEEIEFRRLDQSLGYNNGRKSNLKNEIVKDFLPFGTMIMKIAASMPGAPKKPEFDIELQENEFDKKIDLLYQNVDKKYKKIVFKVKIPDSVRKKD